MSDPPALHVVEKLWSGDAHCDADAEEIELMFHCPGCKGFHSYRIKGLPGRPVWTWNGSLTAPTLEPSLLINGSRPESRCHLFLRNGIVEFLSDCYHDLRGTTFKLPPIQQP